MQMRQTADRPPFTQPHSRFSFFFVFFFGAIYTIYASAQTICILFPVKLNFDLIHIHVPETKSVY